MLLNSMKMFWMVGCVSWWILTRCKTDLCQEKGLLMLGLFSEESLKSYDLKTRIYFSLFVDREKVFDRVPRDATRFVLRRKSVPE